MAAGELGENPEDCLVFEDAPLGVAAGRSCSIIFIVIITIVVTRAAGCRVVMVPDSRLANSERKEANLCLGNLHQFHPQVIILVMVMVMILVMVMDKKGTNLEDH